MISGHGLSDFSNTGHGLNEFWAFSLRFLDMVCPKLDMVCMKTGHGLYVYFATGHGLKLDMVAENRTRYKIVIKSL